MYLKLEKNHLSNNCTLNLKKIIFATIVPIFILSRKKKFCHFASVVKKVLRFMSSGTSRAPSMQSHSPLCFAMYQCWCQNEQCTHNVVKREKSLSQQHMFNTWTILGSAYAKLFDQYCSDHGALAHLVMGQRISGYVNTRTLKSSLQFEDAAAKSSFCSDFQSIIKNELNKMSDERYLYFN